MRSGPMSKALLLACAGWLCAEGRACGAETGVPLPPLAVVKSEDLAGKTWRQSGELRGTVEGASREFRQALAGRGWRLEKAIAMGRLAGRSALLVCSRGRQRILVMVWEKEVGTCGFAWGRET